MRIPLYLRTARNLKPRQLLYYPLRRLQRATRSLLPGYTSWRYRLRGEVEVGTRGSMTQVALEIADALYPDATACCEGPKRGELTLLGRTHAIDALDWEEYYDPPLWAYAIHYFDHAVPLALAARRGDRSAYQALDKWLRLWMACARPGRGPGWEPYPISQRLANWAIVDLLLSDRPEASDLLGALRRSACQQAGYLAANLEHHLLANHLLKNATALYLAGLVWPGIPGGQKWFRQGSRLLCQELAEQLLPDGAHFERTPMYHGLVLQNLTELTLLSLAVGTPPVIAAPILRRMADFHADMTQPDGTRARFNDTSEGLVSDAARVESVYRLLDPEWAPPASHTIEYPDAGYYGYRDSSRGETFIIDAGAPGPDYQPGHAHCDILSFEFYSHGRPWIIDPGVHGYAGDPYRSYVRSTRAHNTLTIAGRDQSEIWDSFRVARMARVLAARARTSGEKTWEFEATYRPYFDRRLSHRRSAARRAPGDWLIMDSVAGATGLKVEGALHFHPSVDVSVEASRLVCRRGNDRLVVTGYGLTPWRLSRGDNSPQRGWFFPAFGVAMPCTTVAYNMEKPEGGFSLRLERT